MSFLEQLCLKKSHLKSTETLVTTPDGRCYLESKGNVQTMVEKPSFGFVVDTKPDNRPVEIIKNLYLGSQDCCEPIVLEEFGIKHVLSIGIEAPIFIPDVVYKFVGCLDLPETNISTVLKESMPFLQKTIVEDCRSVLVHCNAGVSRSSAVIIGFLMLFNEMSYDDAYTVVKSKRSCICPNSGFVKQLRGMKKELWDG